jgi:tetratricopeptide (TPR) repeat protein
VNRTPLAAPLLLAACALPRWQDELLPALAAARAAGRDLVVHFATDAADGPAAAAGLDEPAVLQALARGGFQAVRCAASANGRLWAEWAGYGPGAGIAVVDASGQPWAARPGPPHPGEVAAFLDLCAARRADLAALRARTARADAQPADQLALGRLLLDLGHCRGAEPLLLDAALSGPPAARHWVARLYAALGQPAQAWPWLRHAPVTPDAELTRGLVLACEGRDEAAVAAFDAALQGGGLGPDRPQALLGLGASLHALRRDDRALPILRALAAEAAGGVGAAAAARLLDEFSGR